MAEAVRRAAASSSAPEGFGVALRDQPEGGHKVEEAVSVADVRTGPKNPTSTVLTVKEDAVVVAFRKHTLLPLDGRLYVRQPTIPTPT